MSDRADLHTLTGAYAADALDPVERDAFERHLQECADCRQEVAELRATTARLAGASYEHAARRAARPGARRGEPHAAGAAGGRPTLLAR